MEHLLHYVWKHKLYPLRILRTTAGLLIEIIDPGLHNSDSGPDFFNAKLRINGTLWVGNVEIHTRSSDWYRHGHDRDKAYDSVILHIASYIDTEVTRSNGETVPQIQLECPEYVRAHYQELHDAEQYPACYSIIGSLPKFTIHSWLTALQTERLEQKAKLIARRLEHCNNHWEDAFFITLARNYGFGLNGDAFETWANMLPFRAVDKHRNDLFQIEAFFFGQAGLLEENFSDKVQEDEYSLGLRKEFRYLQHKFEITKVMDATLWRFLRLHPENFPTIRLAQLAYLYQKADKLFSQLLEAETLSDVRALLCTRTSAYWETHFMFGRKSSQKERPMGEKSLDLIIINTVIPFLYTYGLHKAEEKMCSRSERFLEELKAENNHIIRAWREARFLVVTAADSQALIQLQKEYCDKKKCLYCRFGYEYLRKK
ncbi:DUF2851 family protein [Bacteroides sp.]|uniref:DUF2851 family protein n=1 Tax=Bacteroides sp. TaxID=29523 RepID=UPI00260C863D|nr:DUF2851 family protein [Bacteroides sp.]MDD3036395.1 DUF2851 family protein [Bacteroides sp.]